MFLTMLIGGLWHGAGWNFVLWGGLHGAFLIINHAFRALTKGRARVPHLIGWALTFAAVAFAWIFFRAPTMERALEVARALNPISALDPFFNADGPGFFSAMFLDMTFSRICRELLLLLACLAIAVLAPNACEIFSKIKAAKYKAAFAFGVLFDVAIWFMLSADTAQEFLYFQF